MTWPAESLPQHTAVPDASDIPQACAAPQASAESGVEVGAASCSVELSPMQSGVPDGMTSAHAKAAPAARPPALAVEKGPLSTTKLAFEKSTAAAGDAAVCACAEAMAVATAPKQASEVLVMMAQVKLSAEATLKKAPLGAKASAEVLLKHESVPEGERAHVWARPGLDAEKEFMAGRTHIPDCVIAALSKLHSPQHVVFRASSEAQSVAAPAESDVKGVQRVSCSTREPPGRGVRKSTAVWSQPKQRKRNCGCKAATKRRRMSKRITRAYGGAHGTSCSASYTGN